MDGSEFLVEMSFSPLGALGAGSIFRIAVPTITNDGSPIRATGGVMIEPTAIHHQRLTVSDVERSLDFYTRVLGFRLLRQRENARVLGAGSILLVLAPPPHQATPGDRFNPNRIGLDHLCFSLPAWSDLEALAGHLTAAGVPHSGVKDLGPEFGFGTLTFEDPDGIQLEFAATHPRD